MIDIPQEIDDEEVLNRRIHPTFVKPDGRPSSQAFKDPEMSVDRAKYRPPDESIHQYPEYGLAGFDAALARELEQKVESQPELLNPAHAVVRGKKSKSVARRLARAASWVIGV